MLSVIVAALALLGGVLFYRWVDIQRRKRVLEAGGIPVITQLFHFTSMITNLFPASGIGLSIFPYRWQNLEDIWPVLFKKHNTNMLAFVTYGSQEVFTKYPIFRFDQRSHKYF